MFSIYEIIAITYIQWSIILRCKSSHRIVVSLIVLIRTLVLTHKFVLLRLAWLSFLLSVRGHSLRVEEPYDVTQSHTVHHELPTSEIGVVKDYQVRFVVTCSSYGFHSFYLGSAAKYSPKP